MDRYVKKILKFKDIIIYGEGVVGKQTLEALVKLGIGGKVRHFAKSERNFAPYKVNGIKVMSIYDLKKYYKSAIFLLAVSDKYISEITHIVKRLGIRHFIDARKLYLDSYKKNDFILFLRKLRNEIYEKAEGTGGFWGREKIFAAHITYCFVQNAGDTVLSWCVRRFLNLRKWNIRNVREPVDDTLISKINETDMLVIGGGGLFLPDTNTNNISGWQWAVSNQQIQQIQVPIVIFSVGYNYFWGQSNSDLFVDSVNHIVRKADFVGLRNMGSVRAIRNIVDDDIKEKITYQPCTTTLIRKICKVQVKKNTKKVAFNVAFDREERRYGNKKEIILSQIARAALFIEQLGYRIVYTAHSDDDFDFLPYLDHENVHYSTKNLTQSLPYEVIRFYQNIEVTVGMRGHAQMIPFGVGGKIISLGTHDKMRWFLQDVHLEDCYVDLSSQYYSISSRICNIFKEIVLKNPAEMDNRLTAAQERLWRISCKNRKKIIEIAKGAGHYERSEGNRDLSSPVSQDKGK